METAWAPRTVRRLLAVASLLCSHAAWAQPLFPNPVYTVGTNPYPMAMADLNGDAIQDLVIANYGTGFDGDESDLSVLMGRGDGTFQDETRVAGGWPADVLAADFDQDGLVDLVLFYQFTAEAVLRRGGGDGSFGPDILIASGIYRLQLADVNDDLIPDLLSAVTGGFQALIGQGDGTFAGAPAVTPGTTSDWIVADVNGDGRDDVLARALVAVGFPREILIFLGAGDGSFAPPGSLTTPDPVLWLMAADVDGDGVDDVGAQTYHPQPSGINLDLRVYFSKGDGSLEAGPVEEGVSAVALLAADLNGDGIQDVVRIGDGDVEPFLGLGGRAYTKLPYFYSGSRITTAVLGDFDGDRRLDLATLANGSEAVFIHAGNGDGSFGPPVDETLRDTVAAVTDDFDGDGRLDIAAAEVERDRVAIELGHGDGTFGPESYYAAGVGPQLLASADMNGDGRSDLVAVARNYRYETPEPFPTATIVVLIGNGDGTFQPPASYETDFVPANAMHVRDLDGDGVPDVLVATFTDIQQLVQPDLAYLHGNADGTLGSMVRLPAGTGYHYPYGWTIPQDLASGDFDADGLRDIVVAVSGLPQPNVAGTVRILRGLGGGVFADPVTVAEMVSSTSVAVADLDGDGSDDIAVADAGFPGPPNDPGGVCILLNDGSGVFAQSGLLGAGIAPDDVQVADLTGDGEPDLAVASEAWYLAILPGRTGGSFGAAMNFGLMGAPLALVNGDFDGDTLRDLLVVSSSGAFVLTNQSEAPPELIIDARVSLDNPRGLGSGTLAWTTNTERDLTGFNVVVFIDDRRQQLNRAVIPCAECTTGGGAAYSFTVPIRHVWRRLYIEAIHLDGTLEIFGPARRHLPRRR